MKIDEKATKFFCIHFHLFTEWYIIFVSLNILLIVHLEFSDEFKNVLSTSPIFKRDIGLTLIKKILFLIIFPWIGMKLTTEEQNIDYSTEIVLNEVNKLLDNFAPCEKPTKFNSKPRITPGLQKSISLKNKSLSDFLQKKGSYY